MTRHVWSQLRAAVVAGAVAGTLIAGGTIGSSIALAEDIKLRMASGHPAVNTYVNLMQTFFAPEVTKRVKERTKHTLEFIEGYGGAMVKVNDTLEGVQTGIIDIGGCQLEERRNGIELRPTALDQRDELRQLEQRVA